MVAGSPSWCGWFGSASSDFSGFIFVGRRGPQKDRWCSTERPRASRELWGVLSVPCGKLPPNLPGHVATFVTDTRLFPARRLRKSNLHEIPIFTTETDTFFTSTRHAHFLMIVTLCVRACLCSRGSVSHSTTVRRSLAQKIRAADPCQQGRCGPVLAPVPGRRICIQTHENPPYLLLCPRGGEGSGEAWPNICGRYAATLRRTRAAVTDADKLRDEICGRL